MNLTPEPISWFDLVTACGLTDVRATSIHDMLSATRGPAGSAKLALPSVRETAEMLAPRFGQAYKRDIRDLKDGGGEAELVELCELAQEEAVKQNKAQGGWAKEPDLTARST